jgi:hypothetical protein
MFEMCGGKEFTIEAQLLDQLDTRGDKELAFRIVLNELILSFQRDHARSLLVISNIFLKREFLNLTDILEIITTLSSIRTNFISEDEYYLYEQLEKDLIDLCNAYLKL